MTLKSWFCEHLWLLTLLYPSFCNRWYMRPPVRRSCLQSRWTSMLVVIALMMVIFKRVWSVGTVGLDTITLPCHVKVVKASSKEPYRRIWHTRVKEMASVLSTKQQETTASIADFKNACSMEWKEKVCIVCLYTNANKVLGVYKNHPICISIFLVRKTPL